MAWFGPPFPALGFARLGRPQVHQPLIRAGLPTSSPRVRRLEPGALRRLAEALREIDAPRREVPERPRVGQVIGDDALDARHLARDRSSPLSWRRSPATQAPRPAPPASPAAG